MEAPEAPATVVALEEATEGVAEPGREEAPTAGGMEEGRER